MKIRELAEKYEDQIIAWRREFHENPEISGEEIRTSERVCEELLSANIDSWIDSELVTNTLSA